MDSPTVELPDNEAISLLTVSQSFEERSNLSNGVNLLPEEMITKIFDYVEPYELLKLSEVCQKWNVIIKQPYLWRKKYQRKYKEQPKRYSWYLLFSMVATNYYDINPVIRGNADTRFTNWTDSTPHFISPIDGFHLTTMQGCLPIHMKTISKCVSRTKIFINEKDMFDFGSNKLATSIMKAYKPIIYSAEWTSCSIVTHSFNHPKLTEIINNGRLSEYCTKYAIESALTKWLISSWEKMPIVITDYSWLDKISFIHVILVNPGITPQSPADDLINAIEKKAKILVCSLPD